MINASEVAERVILHRRLRNLLARCGVDPARPDLQSLLQALHDAFSQWDMEVLQRERQSASQKRELQALFSDLAGEHFKLQTVLHVVQEPVAGLDEQGVVLFSSQAFDQLWPHQPVNLLTSMLPTQKRLSGPASSLQDFFDPQDPSRPIEVELHPDQVKMLLYPALNSGKVMGGVLASAAPRVREELPTVLLGAPPYGSPQIDLLGVRVAVVESDAESARHLRDALSSLGTTAVILPPTQESVTRLVEAAEAGVPFELLMMNYREGELLTQVESEPALTGLPALAIGGEGEEPSHWGWIGTVTPDISLRELGNLVKANRFDASTTAIQSAVISGPPSLRVLVVEEDQATRRMLEDCVRELGHEFHVANDGQHAWELHSQKPYNVIISDWVMPVVTGVELCQRVRSHPAECYTYFLLLTDRQEGPGATEIISEVVAEVGADDYLSKPLQPQELQRRLRVAGRFASQEQELRRVRHGA